MNEQIAMMQHWIDKRTQREKIYLFAGGLVIIYLIYALFFSHPLSAKKAELQQQVTDLQTKITTLQGQIAILNISLKSPAFLQMQAAQKKLTAQINNMQQQISAYNTGLFSQEELPSLTKKILIQKANSTGMISMKQPPVEPWPPQDPNDKSAPVSQITTGYQHIVQIEFQNDYFNTIAYLKRLEAMSQHMFWDNLTYKVTKYPNADVAIKFHVLSLQKS